MRGAFAIVGADCLLPGAPTVADWQQLDAPALTEVPAGRWPTAQLPAATRMGGFVEARPLDTADLALDVPIEQMDPLFSQVLHTVRGALEGASVPRERTCLLLASLSLPTTGAVRAVAGPWRRRLADVGVEVPWLAGGTPHDRSQSGGAARIAARALGLLGGACALDAACASGLYAVLLACDRLAAGLADAAVAAAVNRADASYLFAGFTALRALSPTGVPRPLDAAADGLVIGEGAAAVLIKRLDDAVAAGDPVLAVLRGGGLGNDGRKGNMLAPSGPGQRRALEAAWAGLGVDGLGYVECHATGTPVGDRTEIEALDGFLADRRPRDPVAVASSKALIGHTVTTAGLAGLLRAVGAVHGGRLPRAVGCDDPLEALRASRWLVPSPGGPWPGDGPRRAAVSAFGFGGTNAHVVVEAWEGQTVAWSAAAASPPLEVVGLAACVGGHDARALRAALTEGPTPLRPAPPQAHRGAAHLPRGAWIGEVAVDPGRYRIPPLELARMLPQQLLALDVAADALEDAGPLDGRRVATVIAMEVDSHAAEAVIGHALAGVDQAAPVRPPPLDAAAVQGSLPNFVANRISAQRGLEGPSYTVSAGEGSGAEALLHAARLLAMDVADAVVVGAVDFPGHVGALEAAGSSAGPLAEGAVMLVVQRAPAGRTYGRVASRAPAHRDLLGHGGALDGMLAALHGLCDRPWPPSRVEERPRTLRVPHSGPALPYLGGPFAGAFGGDRVPVPRPRVGPVPRPSMAAGPPSPGRLPWVTVAPPAPPAPAAPSLLPLQGAGPAGLATLAVALGRHQAAVADVHDRFLAQRARALQILASTVLPAPPGPAPVPRTYDRAALVAHATGRLSEVFGPGYADLDEVEPRVRMPAPPLLLCSRVVALEGERGTLGPSRIVTEYDVPHGQAWSDDGRPPACVVVESGQADLFLVSFLGIDAETRGERVYRLLDCDLTFHGPRPAAGTTLRHDIRIERFAGLGGTTLFTFHYDCIVDGAPLLTMRHGCAGFFTPAELADPRGLDVRPTPPRVTPIAAPPPGPWQLLHRVAAGPDGVVAEQDLADDDWFNAGHFPGDPCMPGTLMLEGCLQAVHGWLVGRGLASWRDAAEPLQGCTTRLRCRGQVAPGHRQLVYTARVTAHGSAPHPWARADVVLSVDGVPVVSARDVGVSVPVAARLPGRAALLEFAVGEPARAFGGAWAETTGRCARIPGPPLMFLSRVEAVEGPPGVLQCPATVEMAVDVPEADWLFEADPSGVLPLAAVMEIALQPCGWLTAWQGSPLRGGDPADRYFRNLGGEGTQLAAIGPGTALRVVAIQTSSSESGGMQVVFFDAEVHAGETVVYRCSTHFGYFSGEALRAQKGLDIPPQQVPAASGPLLGAPRADWCRLDGVVAAEPGRRYVAQVTVDPDAWYFAAHFHEDPVMPGSLGIEAMVQLARHALIDCSGPGRIVPSLDATMRWKYRGQILQSTRAVRVELTVTSRDDHGLTADAVLHADGVALYQVEGLAVRRQAAADPPVRPVVPPPSAAPLLDRFDVEGDLGQGLLRLDPARFAWLDDHRPTLTAPALPLAFAAEIAAEAALALRPAARVVGLPELSAEHWIHCGDGPVDVHVTAVGEGAHVAVTLAVEVDNRRFPALSGLRVHMRAVVELRDVWYPAVTPPSVAVAPDLGARDLYDGGHTFHGPALQAVTTLHGVGPVGAVATLAASEGPWVLDPVLLDAATHPMLSATPERWVPGLAPGRLAYPVRAEAWRFFGPRPRGEVRATLRLVEATAERIAFDVHLGSWCAYRWIEALVPAGPLLGHPAPVRRAFLWEGRGRPEVAVGRPTDTGWEVRRDDLVEPLPGTTWGLTCDPAEPRGDLVARLAAKEAVRAWLRGRLGRDIHPRHLVLERLRPDRFVVVRAPTLTAQEFTDHLGPTRWVVEVREDEEAARARVVGGTHFDGSRGRL